MRPALKLLLLLPTTALLAGCGIPGAPLPPSLQLPRPISDLSATRVGDQVNISFQLPDENTDRLTIKHLGAVILEQCPAHSPAEPSCTPLKTWPKETLKPGAPVTLTIPLPRDNNLAVVVQNDLGKSAGPSNLVYVPLGPAWPNLQSVTAQATPDAVVLSLLDTAPRPASANGTQYRFRILRSQPNQKRPQPIGEVPTTSDEFRDTNFDWQQHYTYEVHTINHVSAANGEALEFESGPPVTASLETVDIFPPAAPTGLAAILNSTQNGAQPGKISIDLSWIPSPERDLAGYNIYRSINGGEVQKLNTAPLAVSEYRDFNITFSSNFTYFVTAIDLRGNESKRSTPATEHVPQQP